VNRNKILLTGANGYIGKRLLEVLINMNFDVVCCVRDAMRFNLNDFERKHIEVIEIDLLNRESLDKLPADIDGAYYLVHSMSSNHNFDELERICALNFVSYLNQTTVKHVIYLSGIVNSSELSKHLDSRKNVEDILAKGTYNFTCLRAGIIIGSGSASFEIIRDLVEKLPVMITPKWLRTRCQPIGISDVLLYLSKSLFEPQTYNEHYDIGSTDILSYKEMLLGYAEARNLKRYIYIVPVMTPRISSYWLYFVTSTSYRLAVSLVDSMKTEVICSTSDINSILSVQPIGYKEALDRAFSKISSKRIASSWKDSFTSSGFNFEITETPRVPEFGCFRDKRIKEMKDKNITIDKLWRIGGETGWYHADFLWELRGFIDKLSGGVGLRRGRTNIHTIHTGDAIDFWRVIHSDKNTGHLTLYAEMKLPGEAWLEFKIVNNRLVQTATFRPLGVYGRMYWYAVLPFHSYIFNGMLNKLTSNQLLV
jgi:uncharacterized protein YbjT (DUF2867 family)